MYELMHFVGLWGTLDPSSELIRVQGQEGKTRMLGANFIEFGSSIAAHQHDNRSKWGVVHAHNILM